MLLFLLSFVAVNCPVFAQQNTAPVPPPAPVAGRARIGLALAGGSALGEAHIGVLAWLEEHHVPVDYIAGTSMGGLVAGAYSCGYSPDALKSLLRSVDWQSALRGDVPYAALAFRRKEDLRAVPNAFEFGVRRGITLPVGFNPAQKIGLLLSEVAYSNPSTGSFDDLPIPFRCVATDLRSGEAVLLKDGSLATALRATMSLPALFTPVMRGGRLLADGGIVDNLPTGAVRDMGAEKIIAVDLNASGLAAKDATLQSLLDVAGRSVTLAIRGNERQSIKIADIVLAPDLQGFTGNDFALIDEYFKRGYAAAEARKAALLPLAVDDATWNVYIAARAARRGTPPARPAFLTVSGPNGSEARRIAGELQPLIAAPFPSAAADERLTLLTGDGRYDSVLYEAVKDERGRSGVRILAQKKPYGPPFLKAGLEIDGSDTGSVLVNAVTRLISLDAGLPGAETRLDLRLGSNVGVSGEYYVPVGGGTSPFFVASRLFYDRINRNVSQNGSRVAVFGTEEFGAVLDAGWIPDRFTQVRAGFGESRFGSGLRTGTDLPAIAGEVRSFHLTGTWDRFDEGIIPSSGSRSTATVTRYLRTLAGSTALTTGELSVSRFFPSGANLTLFTRASGGTSFGRDAPPQLQFTLGGPLRLGSVAVEALRGDQYYLLTAGILRRFPAPPPFGGRTVVGTWLEYGGVSGGAAATGDKGSRLSLSGGVITETFLGPVLLGVGVGDNGRGGVRILPYFTLGRVF